MFASLLIANRGEIARRITRTARAMGVRTIAVYTDADRTWPHRREADEAVLIGEGPAASSYLDIAKVVGAARETGAEAVHPGYGFLAENADFAEACADAGLTFVGPPPEAIRAMGSKARARALMQEAGVPVVPGYHGAAQDTAALAAEAERIGYPVLVKAVAGGGGRGMRRVDSPSGFNTALQSARREAASAFGDGNVLIERLVLGARHVEVQVMADGHGNVVHLYERDCSVQRRHQKVIEEAPASDLPERLREALWEAAVTAGRAVGYRGAGTVEFIVPRTGDAFHFLEMNTRLQVEHPVTEMITGLDLVEWQLRIAAGERLPLAQDGIALAGHAFEARLCAEDSGAGFRPSTGVVRRALMPEGDGVRADSGVSEGTEVTAHYDSLLAKIVVHGATREQALMRLAAALRRAWVAGPRTNQAFLMAIVTHPQFARGPVDTGFVADQLETLTHATIPDWAVAEAVRRLVQEEAEAAAAKAAPGPWARTDGFESGGISRSAAITVQVRGAAVDARLSWRDGALQVSIAGDDRARPEGAHFDVVVSGGTAFAVADGVPFDVFRAGALAQAEAATEGSGLVRAPMHGRVVTVAVAVADQVEVGQPLFAVEAMKMETTMPAPVAGTVSQVTIAPGDQIAEGAVVVTIEPASPA